MISDPRLPTLQDIDGGVIAKSYEGSGGFKGGQGNVH